MTKTEILAGFNQMIQATLFAGDHDAVARLEVAREYFTNPKFKKLLQDNLWVTAQARR